MPRLRATRLTAIAHAVRRQLPLWLSLVQQAEAAAAAAGASLWYVPPAGYADRSVNGPFVGSDGSGGVPALGSGVVGWLRDGAAGQVSTPNLATTPHTGTTSGAWTFGADIRRNGTTTQPASVSSVAGMTAAGTYLFTFTLADFSGDGFTLAANGQSLGVGQITGNGVKSFVGTVPASGSPTLQFIPWNGTVGQATITGLSVRRVFGNHAIQSTSANRPVFVPAPGAAAAADGFAAMSFDGSNDQLLTSLTTPATSTLILAVRAGALANTAPFGTGDNADTNVVVLKFRSNGEIWSRRNNASTSEIATLAAAYSANEQFVISSEFDSDRQRVYKNGSQIGAQVFSGGFTAGSGSARLGSIVNGFESFNGQIVGAALIPSANSAASVPIERLFAFMAGATYTG